MKNESFDYLKPFISPPENTEKKPRNWFYSVEESEIKDAEKRLGFQFPDQLRNFYQRIGYGSLKVPYRPSQGYKISSDNYINPPSMLADIILLGHDSGYIAEDVLEFMEPGDLPFFHIGDSSSFLFMKPKSKNPNAVYSLYGNMIEKEFNKFIWRLYYESPSYYEDLL